MSKSRTHGPQSKVTDKRRRSKAMLIQHHRFFFCIHFFELCGLSRSVPKASLSGGGCSRRQPVLLLVRWPRCESDHGYDRGCDDGVRGCEFQRPGWMRPRRQMRRRRASVSSEAVGGWSPWQKESCCCPVLLLGCCFPGQVSSSSRSVGL